ncbi:MAG TPA: S-adenosylmethionine:tRNA ribosyltransferase-isomerase [Flavobacteriales bacterium]|nr:S-adenosylmethionine:tRNA ribosyltransferase-isomerase [Flavobacteriales bacterium]
MSQEDLPDPRLLSLEALTYDLPAERIAQYPLEDRASSKLLVYREGRIQDRLFRDLPDQLPGNSLLVLNDTRVVHARIHFRRVTGALIECMVLTPGGDRPIELALNDKGSSRWWCMLGNAKRWKGEELAVEKDGHRLFMAKVEERAGEFLLEFRWEGQGSFLEQMDLFGAMPLPPYMKRAAEEADDVRYNTVFAERPGSVAAPTASLHFTAGILEALRAKGVQSTQVTLHVGAGTFLPVKSSTMGGHDMHREQVRIPRGSVQRLLAQAGQGPIIPVGTTAMRTIESLYWHGAALVQGQADGQLAVGQWQPYMPQPEVPVREALQAVLEQMEREGTDVVTGATRLLIAPGYRFRLSTGLITNFHQPHSTLLLLVAALIGPDWHKVYDHALAHGYRFLSFGDGSLLWAP